MISHSIAINFELQNSIMNVNDESFMETAMNITDGYLNLYIT